MEEIIDNRTIARKLRDVAHSLAAQQGNLYRMRAYRRAAESIDSLDQPVEELLAGEGCKGLKGLPGIGPSLALKIETLVRASEIATLSEADQALVVV